MDYKNISYTSKIEDCPFCSQSVKFKGYSKESVRHSIQNLYLNMNTHFADCTLKKGDKKLVKVSINTRKTSDTLYTSEFATDFILVD